nr:hypothetical protein HK105_002004 [Polyrhizophydium stewartii]
MFLGSQITGLLIISKIQSIIQNQFGKDADTAILINSLLSGANLLGRLVVPLTSDALPFITSGFAGRKSVFLASLLIQGICVAYLPTAILQQDFTGFLACVFVIAFWYGAGFGVIPAFVADQFGAKNVGATHGVMLLAWATGAVIGGIIFTAVLKMQESIYAPNKIPIYNLNFRWILALVVFGFLIGIFVQTNIRDRRLPYAPGEVPHIRFVNGRMLRFYNNFSVKMPSAQEEEDEWVEYLRTTGHF